MKQIKNRVLIVWVLFIGFLVGLSFFIVEYISQGNEWASFQANEHAYSNGDLTNGQIYDRNGLLLYDAATGSYSDDKQTRKSTLHAVGDKDGNISTSAKYAFKDRLIGYNLLTGTQNGGNSLLLTIDSGLNNVAAEALGNRKGTVGVYNYKTGEILCMYSSPTFDPESPPTITEGDSQYDGVYLNRFLSSSFVPGSIFKVVTAAAAIDTISGLSTREFTCTGKTVIGDTEITCPKKHGTMDFYGALANSCNCAFAELAVEIGSQTLYEYAETAGLLESISVDGIMTVSGSFTIGESSDLGWSGVGQYEDLVNPCSYMVMMGSIANGGNKVLPRLILQEKNSSGRTIYSGRATTDGTTFSQETCSELKEMLRNDVTATYGQSKFGDLSICAKSGTAEVGDGTSHAWFSGFLDDDTYPYAFVVLVENGGGGATVAGSVAAKVLQEAVSQS